MIFNFIKQNKLFSIYSFSVILIICIAVLAPILVLHDPYEANMLKALQTPNNEYFLGTDKLGRDIFSRIIYGMQISLFMTICIVILTATIGSIIGIIAGYFGGKIELILMRLADIMLSFPGIILAIAIAGIMGGSIINTIFA